MKARLAPIRSAAPSSDGRRARSVWIYGRGTDLLIAWCWVPIWLAAHTLSAGHGVHNDDLLRRALDMARDMDMRRAATVIEDLQRREVNFQEVRDETEVASLG